MFRTLAALAAMSLMSLSLMQAVDTTTLISGNLAFRRAAVQAVPGYEHPRGRPAVHS